MNILFSTLPTFPSVRSVENNIFLASPFSPLHSSPFPLIPPELVVEDLEMCVERAHPTQAWVPLRVVHRPDGSAKPVVLFLHPTGVRGGQGCGEV